MRYDIEGGVDRTGGGLNTMLPLMVVLFAMRHELTGRTPGHWINKIDAVGRSRSCHPRARKKEFEWKRVMASYSRQLESV